MVINSQQFSFSLPFKFERVDFPLRLMIGDTFFPVYSYTEGIAIWGG